MNGFDLVASVSMSCQLSGVAQCILGQEQKGLYWPMGRLTVEEDYVKDAIPLDELM